MITTLPIPVLLKFCLPPDVETTEQSPSYKLSYHQLFRCTILPFVPYLALPSHCPCPFSSQPSLQLDLLSCSPVLARETILLTYIVTPHSYTALLSTIMSLYYLNEFHAC